MPRQRHQACKVQQNQNGSWFIRPYVDVVTAAGIERKKTTITFEAKGAREAQRIANEKLQTINNSEAVIKSQILVSDLIGKYERAHMPNLGSGTRDKYACHLRKHIGPTFGALMLCEVTPLLVQEWLQKQTLSWHTKTDIRNILSGLFTCARHWGYWQQENPIQHVSLGRKKEKREKRKLTEQQTRDILAELQPMPRLVVMVALFGTLRVSEILGLQEKHLNFKSGLIEIRQRHYRGDIDDVKSATSRREVPMGALREFFRDICTGNPERYVFISHESCRTDNNIRSRHLRPAAKRLGIYYEGFGFHSFRREAITEIGKKIGITQVMKMAGHSKMAMTQLYTLADQHEQEMGANDFSGRILN